MKACILILLELLDVWTEFDRGLLLPLSVRHPFVFPCFCPLGMQLLCRSSWHSPSADWTAPTQPITRFLIANSPCAVSNGGRNGCRQERCGWEAAGLAALGVGEEEALGAERCDGVDPAPPRALPWGYARCHRSLSTRRENGSVY